MKKKIPPIGAKPTGNDELGGGDSEQRMVAAEQVRERNEVRREAAEQTRAGAERDRATAEAGRRAVIQAVKTLTTHLEQTTSQMKALEEMRRSLHHLLTGESTPL